MCSTDCRLDTVLSSIQEKTFIIRCLSEKGKSISQHYFISLTLAKMMHYEGMTQFESSRTMYIHSWANHRLVMQ